LNLTFLSACFKQGAPSDQPSLAPLYLPSWPDCSVGVDLAAEADGGENACPHDFLARVLGHVDLEETSVRLWQVFVSTAL